MVQKSGFGTVLISKTSQFTQTPDTTNWCGA